MKAFWASIYSSAVSILLMVAGALLLWVIGRWAIGVVTRMTAKNFERRKVDSTLTQYFTSAMAVSLNLLLIVAILSVFGIETTSFAAVFAAAGLAVGMAWSGLLSNFASGVMMIVLRPFKVGDFIQAGGVTGEVEEIGLFVTTVNTLDNVRTFIGNSAVFGGNISNFTANPHRRVELVAQLAHGANVDEAITLLKGALAKIPNVISDPAPEVDVLTFNLAGTVLAVRPHCHNDHYWAVYFATNDVIRNELGAAGFPTPHHQYVVQGGPALPGA